MKESKEYIDSKCKEHQELHKTLFDRQGYAKISPQYRERLTREYNSTKKWCKR